MLSAPADTPPVGERSDPLLDLIAVLMVALPLVPAHMDSARGHGFKTLVFEMGAALLLGLSFCIRSAGPSLLARVPRWGAVWFLRLLALWATVSVALSPDILAVHGWWLLVGGIVTALVVAARTRQRQHYLVLLDAFNVLAIVLAVVAAGLYLVEGLPVAEGTYHDHEILGAVFTILLPMTLAAATSPVTPARKTVGLIAFVLSLLSLLMAQARSSWIAAAVSLLLFGALTARASRDVPRRPGTSGARQRQRILRFLYTVLVLFALGYFLASADQGSVLARRAGTLVTTVPHRQDSSLEWRLRTWRGVLTMIEQRPWLGWGIGGYPLSQQPFTGTGDSPLLVAQNGPRIGDEAHNSYLQIAAEMGIPGLLLWLAALGTAFAAGLRAVRRLRPQGLRQRALIGSLAALAGQAVDALANPGWQFGEAAVYFWIALGLTLAATQAAQNEAEQDEEGSEAAVRAASLPFPLWQTAGALLLAAGIIAAVIASLRLLPTPQL